MMTDSDPSQYLITFMRHGESIANASGLLQGQSDWPLTENGADQASRAAQKWIEQKRSYNLVISSPLSRASQTAKIIAEELGLPLFFDPLWCERNFGEFETKSYEELSTAAGSIDFSQPIEPTGGGESLYELYLRAGKALLSLFKQPPGSYLVVSHGAMLNMTLFHIMSLSPYGNSKSPRFIFSNTGYIDLSYNPEQRQWRILNFRNPD